VGCRARARAVVKLLLEKDTNKEPKSDSGRTLEVHNDVEQLLMTKGASDSKDLYGLQLLFSENHR
jgi:hypothetical protein